MLTVDINGIAVKLSSMSELMCRTKGHINFGIVKFKFNEYFIFDTHTIYSREIRMAYENKAFSEFLLTVYFLKFRIKSTRLFFLRKICE